jgi:hypothetical protein
MPQILPPWEFAVKALLLFVLPSLVFVESPSGAKPRRVGDEVRELVARVRTVGPQGAGSAEARQARDQLAARGPEVIVPLLEGMDTPDTVAANWLRTAFDEVVARTIRTDRSGVPATELRRFVLDAKRRGRVRRLALDVLARLDPAVPGELIPPLVDDPEFRRDAVAAALERGDRAAAATQRDDAIAAYTTAFDAARDADQVRAAAAKLKSLGHDVSIVEHLGFVIDWHVIGPFHGPDFKAFTMSYPPEQQIRTIDLAASFDGQRGKVTWKHVQTPDEFGTVDLVKALEATDDAAAYAFTTIDSPEPRDVQIRCGADDNLTIWLNAERVFGKDEWQNGTRLDRFIVPVRLRAGRNEILVKVCQGPKYRDPGMANLWSMQLRICDATGKGVRFPKPIDEIRSLPQNRTLENR